MEYKKIKTNGIEYLELVEGTDKWYWGSDYCNGDLYEAEELFQTQNTLNGNRLIVVKYPEGNVVEPISKKEDQYFGRPIFDDGLLIILLVDFYESKIKLIQYDDVRKELKTIVEIDRTEITDCYNLLLRGSPVYLSRNGHEGNYEILWPDTATIKVEENEIIFKRSGEILFSSVWFEVPEYHEDTIIRKYPTGEVIDRISGNLMTMPDKQNWIVG